MNKVKRNRIFILTILIAAIAAPLLANPILSHKYTADPQPIVWNERLYVYASNDDQSPPNDYLIQAYTLVSTDDMANWTDHGEVFRVPRDWNRGTAASARAYAPGAAVRRDSVFLYPCGAGGPVGVVTAASPYGPFRDVLRPANGGTTPALVDRNTCTNCNVPWLFDPAVFVDDDGQAYLYYGGGNANDTPGPGENFRVIRLNDDMVSLRREANNTINAVTIHAPRSFEAAYMHKRNGIYYFSYVNNFAGGDGQPNAAIMYMTGDNPMGPFTFRGPVLRNPAIGNQNINRHNNNHQAIIEYKGKWYMFYHDRRVANANNVPSDNANLRNISVDSLVYNADGTMREVVVTHDGVAQIKNFNPFTTIGATTLNRQSSTPTATGHPGMRADSIPGEGMILTRLANNNWIRLKGVDFGAGASRVTVRAASNNSSGGTIEFRTGSPTGTLIGTVTVASTGSWTAYRNFEADITNAAGVQNFLYLVFRGTGSELLRLSSYQFHQAAAGPDADGYFFHHTFETSGNVNGWEPRFGAGTVANVNTQAANGSRSLAVSGRTENFQGPSLSLSTSIFVPGSNYSFSVLAMAQSAVTFKYTLQYNLGTETFYEEIDSKEAVSGQWVMLENPRFPIPTGAANLVLYVETPGSTVNFFIDDAMGGAENAQAPGRSGATSIQTAQNNIRGSHQMVTVRARMLNVNAPADSKVQIRVVSMAGKTVAKFDTQGSSKISLREIPAGAYIIEARGVKNNTKLVSNVVLR
ncbi:MAG: family 43 glycosylhydrolase [Chitinispirillia bacterium]|nr:family 43 glycosylhydrolase [Chitinispirillia bacterium]